MKFAVFFELPVPRPWTPGKQQAVIRNAVGLLSFAVGVPPGDLIPRVEAYKKGQAECAKPKGKFRNEQLGRYVIPEFSR